MMKTNSREKGKRGEREFAALLREHGFEARRGQQFAGGEESPDVICTALPWLHIEVKRTQALNLADACAQAAGDCHGKPWVVAHRRNHAPWLITMRAELFFELVRGDVDASPHPLPSRGGEGEEIYGGEQTQNRSPVSESEPSGTSTRTIETAEERGLTQSRSPASQPKDRQDACPTAGITPAAWVGEGQSGEPEGAHGVTRPTTQDFSAAADAAAGCRK